MQTIDISQAQQQFTELLQNALNGEEIIITQNDHPILKLSQINPPTKRRQRGSAKGKITIAPEFDEPLEEFQDYMA
jgi:antitoxin (DNA-binding transcriptional repressor) of toxin-antitoxin stability system